MSYIDRQLTVSDNQAVTASAVSTDAIDLSSTSPIRNVGVGRAMYMQFTVGTTVTSGGASTVTFEVIQADDAALTSNVTSLASSPAIAKAALTAGANPFTIALPNTSQRYIGARYTVGTANLTAGTFTATLVMDRNATTNYASGYTDAY